MGADSGSTEATGARDEQSDGIPDADGIDPAERRCAVSLGEPSEE
ncbi:hypothetical protein [Halosimplex amylolyticum]